ncbi:hypothetical protein BHS06_20635 [Myxococcus xanthus]|uniref:hypothetical protein n=1 Tax=Myxococcus xanthus TaxID=34 RepID=UPI001126934D|nr:hypothetical protein [Myxococcus xanthus]QDE91188.1 hypothetical protein BHS06_20635 [Myxococcus xanthus]
MNPSSTQSARKSGNSAIIIFAVVVMVGLMGGVAMLVVGGGFGRGGLNTDVSGLQELAAVQAQLQPLDACHIEYGVRSGVLPHRSTGSRKSASVTPCSGASVSYVSISVPEELQSSQVAFDMTRSSVSAPWQILVDKDQTAFPDLKQSLERLAPLIVEKYPEALATEIQRRVDSERAWQEHKAAERARKEAAKTSYPE